MTRKARPQTVQDLISETAKRVHPEWVRQEVIDYLRESAIFSVERLSYLTEDDLKVCCEGVKWDVGISEAKIRGQRVSLKTAWKKSVEKQARTENSNANPGIVHERQPKS